jgi:hypothetical protein
VTPAQWARVLAAGEKAAASPLGPLMPTTEVVAKALHAMAAEARKIAEETR